MQNCVELFDKSLVRDPRHRSNCASASAQSCKGNRTGAWPTLRTLPTIYPPARMKSRIEASHVGQIQYASFCLLPNQFENPVAARLISLSASKTRLPSRIAAEEPTSAVSGSSSV